MMKVVKENFAMVLEKITVSDARIPVYSNVSASPVTEAGEIKKVIIQQLTSSVRWTETIYNMRRDGVEEACEIGTGNILAGLIKRTDDSLMVTSVSDAKSIQEVLNEAA